MEDWKFKGKEEKDELKTPLKHRNITAPGINTCNTTQAQKYHHPWY